MSEELINAIADMKEDEALRMVQEAIDKGEDPAGILRDCQAAMHIVGDRYEKSEYFLPELIMSGEILKRISDIVKPKQVDESAAKDDGDTRVGKVVLGTVRGDIHDIGKDIVGFMLDVNGFDVTDLGVDVPEEQFVKAIKDVQPQVVALSGFLTLAYDSMKTTIEAIREAGLRDKVKIMIGGGQINDMVRDYVAADAYGIDAMAAVRLTKEWIPAD